MTLCRRNLLGLFVADVVLFVLANVFYHDGHTFNDLSNVLWVAFVVGVVLLILLGIFSACRWQSRRSRAS
jgi:hypothetical protein